MFARFRRRTLPIVFWTHVVCDKLIIYGTRFRLRSFRTNTRRGDEYQSHSYISEGPSINNTQWLNAFSCRRGTIHWDPLQSVVLWCNINSNRLCCRHESQNKKVRLVIFKKGENKTKRVRRIQSCQSTSLVLFCWTNLIVIINLRKKKIPYRPNTW